MDQASEPESRTGLRGSGARGGVLSGVAGPVLLGAVVTAAVALAAWAWIRVPALYPAYVAAPGEPPLSPEVAAARDATRAQAIVTTRASVLAALAGFGALITIAINYRNSLLNARTLATTQDTFRVTERAHLTDRYATAVEQVGHSSIAIRLGGIYALQQLAVDTDRDSDQATVVEVLSAFVRLNLHLAAEDPTAAGTTGARRADPLDPLDRPPSPTGPWRPRHRVAGTGLRRPPTAGANPPGEPAAVRAREPRADVLAAISVLAQLPTRAEAMRADFTGLDFTGVDLSHARLAHGNLTSTRLASADLTDADLTRARLIGARLTRTDLTRADLTDADLTRARLTDADLTDALVSGVQLSSTRSASCRGVDGGDPAATE